MKGISLKNLCKLFLILFLFTLPISCKVFISTGKNPNRKKAKTFQQYPNYVDGHFQNIDQLPKDSGKVKMGKVMRELRNKPETVAPSQPLPFVKTALADIVFAQPTVIWFGHSSFLIKSKYGNILVDPNLSDYAGPVSWVVKAFKSSQRYQVDDLPPIDVLIVSHDHYDHLDYATIKKLKEKVKRVVVPLGIASHLEYWGYDKNRITELNWDQSIEISELLKITVTPSRHDSRRKMFASKKTLWGSFVIQLGDFKFFYSGDTAYGTHFKLIGEKYGPFDLAMMECGQYNKNWRYHHMFPHQTALASQDILAKMILPVHWGKFAESTHPWNESVKLLLPVADSLKIKVTIPQIGQPYTIGDEPKRSEWWN